MGIPHGFSALCLAILLSCIGLSCVGTEKALAAPDQSAFQPMRSAEDQTRLNTLYADLAKSADEETASGLTNSILRLWSRSGSDTVDLLTKRANVAMAAEDNDAAESLLDAVVDIAPNFVEGWNRRATFYFTKGDFLRSMADVQRVLALDPRHFGALSGMGSILQETGQDAAALVVYRQALKVHPFLPGAQRAMETLEVEVEGRGI